MVFLLIANSILLSEAILDPNAANDKEDTQMLIFYSGLVYYIVVCQSYFTWDALGKENTYQLLAGLTVSLLIFVWTAYHFWSNDIPSDIFRDLSLTVSIVNGFCFLIYAILTKQVIDEFGWRMFKKIGGVMADAKLYRSYVQFKSLLRLDVAVSTLVLIFGINNILMWAVLPSAIGGGMWLCILITNFLIYKGVRVESVTFSNIFFAFSWVPVACFIFGIVWYILYGEDHPKSDDEAVVSATQFFITGTILVAIRACLIWSASVCYGNFGKGLLSKLSSPETAATSPLADKGHQHSSGLEKAEDLRDGRSVTESIITKSTVTVDRGGGSLMSSSIPSHPGQGPFPEAGGTGHSWSSSGR